MALIEPYVAENFTRLAQRVGQAIREGGIVAVPTESSYALAVNPFDPRAVARLLAVKGRDDGKPILVVIGHPDQLSGLVQEVPPPAQALMDAFWPGPLTIVLTGAPSLPPALTASTGTVGVRWTSCAPLARLLGSIGPVTGTSANRSGESPACTAEEVQQTLGAALAVIVDAGRTSGGAPSTVVDARRSVRLLREGPITRQMLQNVLQTRGVSVH